MQLDPKISDVIVTDNTGNIVSFTIAPDSKRYNLLNANFYANGSLICVMKHRSIAMLIFVR